MIAAAERLSTTSTYYFASKLQEVAQLAAEGKPIINMGIGSPDLPPPPEAVQALTQALTAPKAHQYQSYRGLPELRQAMAGFYQRHYGVTLDPEQQLLPLMGSKEGIMHISMAYLNPGDEVLLPNPGYPTYAAVTKLVQAHPRFYALSAKNDWLPDLEALAAEDLSKVKLMWINYPHMPTGYQASAQAFEDVVAFAKANDLLLINDNPYSFILNDHPLSLLSTPGAAEHCLELNSLSKSFNLAGWRMGLVAGAPEMIANILKVKSNMDSGMFYGIQKGAAAVLNTEGNWFKNLNATYRKRRALIWKLADRLGCTYSREGAGLFVWAKLPPGREANAFIDELLYTHSIFITPGTVFGSQGTGYIRFSLCVSETDIQEAIKRFE
ncbi:pyridoxal phosphate-dependent aminotransferase [Croceiramulus getboli]|nr:aminotransferase class I/II-fold pyridoxal phosphate-dependent enzyme [Flavobacteriaceae bacterium YJPT1-3]